MQDFHNARFFVEEIQVNNHRFHVCVAYTMNLSESFPRAVPYQGIAGFIGDVLKEAVGDGVALLGLRVEDVEKSLRRRVFDSLWNSGFVNVLSVFVMMIPCEKSYG